MPKLPQLAVHHSMVNCCEMTSSFERIGHLEQHLGLPDIFKQNSVKPQQWYSGCWANWNDPIWYRLCIHNLICVFGWLLLLGLNHLPLNKMAAILQTFSNAFSWGRWVKMQAIFHGQWWTLWRHFDLHFCIHIECNKINKNDNNYMLSWIN